MTSFRKAIIISSGQIEFSRPPPGLAFLSGICEKNNLEYEPYDLNLFILDSLGNQNWMKLYHYTALHNFTTFYKNFDQQIDETLDKFVQILQEKKPDLIIVTVLTYWQNYWCKKLLEKIKEKKLECQTLIGGSGVGVKMQNGKTFARWLCDENILDYYILGEGDIVLDSFLKGSIELGCNSKHDKFETWAPQIDDLNNLPFPSYKKIDVCRYKTADGSGEIAVTGSRGCVRRCTFCDVGNIWKKFRFRSAENLVKEIEKHHLDTGETNFFFTDSLINGSLKNFMLLLEGLVKLKQTHSSLANFQYSGQFIIRPQSNHSEYMYQLMAETGARNIQVGVETGSDRVRFHMQKKFTSKDVDYHMEMCNKYNIGNTLMMLVGYPTETIEDFNETLNMIRRYQKYLINGTLIDINESAPLVLLQNTPLYDMAAELEIEINHSEYSNLSWTSKKNPELTIKERWRRFIIFQRELINLGYPRPAEQEILLAQYLDKIKNLKEHDHVN
jgi:radical SAM superfamily enzyme YgiQ (UPF0313 family)